MDVGQSYGIQWVPESGTNQSTHLLVDAGSHGSNDVNGIANEPRTSENDFLVHDMATEEDIDQIAAENLIFMARDGQMVSDIICEEDMNETSEHKIGDCAENEAVQFNEDYSEAQMVTEEVITDDWVQHQGEERVEIPVEQICGSSSNVLLDSEVPLPTIQDEYTTLRPYPCDFCSRRFRKKISLTNHMVAHQNDRPHVCKLCGSRFFRRSDLINHLKAHAECSEPEIEDGEYMNSSGLSNSHQDNVFHSKEHYYDQDWTYDGTRTQSYPHRSRKFHHSMRQSNSNIFRNIPHSQIKRHVKPKEENYTIDETLRQEEQLRMLERKMHRELQLQMKYEQNKNLSIDKSLENELNSNNFKREDKNINYQIYPILDENKPFVCQQCGLAFAREKAMISHCKTHRIEAPYECGTCNDVFWDLSNLQDHQKTHQFEASNSEYEPEEADETQSDSGSEYMYQSKHDSEYFYCHECGMSFHRQNLLKRHAKLHVKREVLDSNRDGHCCNTCGETFPEALDLLAHAEIHARYPPFKCVLCGESFFEEEIIKNHLNNLHASELTENSCILCGKECRDRKALIKHAWDHSREKCHSCSKCGKNFHNKARLKRHMASHRDKSVICDVCQEEFPDGRTLSNHRHSHNSNPSGKLFPCHECGKTFGSRSSQQIHLRIHTGERPYGCRFCWKAFADGGTLRKHERIHTGEKPYACSVCPRAFNQRVVLREHIRSHHSNLDKKYGTFHCSVCGNDLPNSGALIQHLIQHSDSNTAKQRQPITGPRKYKRRRKLKPHEIERLRGDAKAGGSSDVDMSDFDMQNVDELLGIPEESPSPQKRNKKVTPTTLPTETENITTPKKRYNSIGSTSDKLSPCSWQTKLITSSNDDTYKSLLSNLENTLQSIDTLVVNNSSSFGASSATDVLPAGTTFSNTAIKKETRISPDHVDNISALPKSNSNLPRMIHTKKTRVVSDSNKNRSKPQSAMRLNTNTKSTKLTNFPSSPMIKKTESASSSHPTLEDDFEIISPKSYPPNQISSSPLHIKQEPNSINNPYTCRNNDLYDAQLLLEAASRRKDLEKYNPNIVNDLDEILRSPDKTITNTATTNCAKPIRKLHSPTIADIKMEPISPQSTDSVRRSTRYRRPITSSKYLEYETGMTSLGSVRTTATNNKVIGSNGKTKTDSKHSANTLRTTGFVSDLQVPISSATVGGVMAGSQPTVSQATANTPVQQQQQQRKQQYFECEMCSAVFPDRAQLLDHVPIHI